MKSALGKGSTFYFTARFGLQEDEEAPSSPIDHPPLGEERRLHILLVEDNPAKQILVFEILEKHGHAIVSVNNGKEALETLEKERFDLILMDVQMPAMEGIEATSAIRTRESATGSHIPIIALIGHAMKGDRERFLAGRNGRYSSALLDKIETAIVQNDGQTLTQVAHRLKGSVGSFSTLKAFETAERNRVRTQTAGAVAHEINQPLTVVMGTAQLLNLRMPPGDPNRQSIESLYKARERISEIVKKMKDMQQYATKPYLRGIDIIDFNAAVGGESGQGDA